ncbi:hypothetical protein EJ03DRAFT_264101, partial [Teratosphaeria nubilosa]
TMSAFVSKSRRVRFQLTLRILDLNNVPLVSGQSYVKWHLPSSTAAEHRGRTPKCAIKDHRVVYDYEKGIPVRLVIGRDGMLQECSVHFEVIQEYSAGGKPERINLGQVKLNLAEYVEASDTPLSPTHEDGQGITRRYLMQDSKINSTLKIGILMRYTEGTREYYAPPLRTAPVFGGIAGVISASENTSTPHIAGEGDKAQAVQDMLPSLSATSKENGEMQDMYRRTLAAFWASQPGELKADECIEDIFAGGDGWGKEGRPKPFNHNDQDSSRPGSSGTGTPDEGGGRGGYAGRGHGHRGSQAHKHSGSSAGGARRYGRHAKVQSVRKGPHEVDEVDIRDDLRDWRIGEEVYA